MPWKDPEEKRRYEREWHKGKRRGPRKKGRQRTQWDRHLKHRYGITQEIYDALKKYQRNRCRICGERKPLEVDHNHKTGIVRGLLCDPCNRGLGFFKELPTRLRRAATYLEKHRWQREHAH